MKLSLLVAALAIPALAMAQAKADFSGTWKLDASKSTLPQMGGRGGRGGGAPPDIVIKQTADALTIEREMGGNKITITYKLDGSESANIAGRGETKTKTKWDGSKLVTVGNQTANTSQGTFSFEFTEVRYLEGGNLIVETTRKTPQGEQTSKLVYVKQ